MIRKLLKFFFKGPDKEEKNAVEYPIVIETYGVLESNNPTVDTAYGTVTYLYKDGTKRVFNK